MTIRAFKSDAAKGEIMKMGEIINKDIKILLRMKAAIIEVMIKNAGKYKSNFMSI